MDEVRIAVKQNKASRKWMRRNVLNRAEYEEVINVAEGAETKAIKDAWEKNGKETNIKHSKKKVTKEKKNQ